MTTSGCPAHPGVPESRFGAWHVATQGRGGARDLHRTLAVVGPTPALSALRGDERPRRDGELAAAVSDTLVRALARASGRGPTKPPRSATTPGSSCSRTPSPAASRCSPTPARAPPCSIYADAGNASCERRAARGPHLRLIVSVVSPPRIVTSTTSIHGHGPTTCARHMAPCRWWCSGTSEGSGQMTNGDGAPSGGDRTQAASEQRTRRALLAHRPPPGCMDDAQRVAPAAPSGARRRRRCAGR